MPLALAADPFPEEAAAGQSAAVAGKDARAFRTISEVAEDLDVPQHVLRFWETRFGQIRPLKRAGGRRYYRPEDVDLVAGIRHLLHVRRYTIAGAQRVVKENGVRFVQAVGRGEAVAAAPLSQEAETGIETGTGAGAGEGAMGTLAAGTLMAADRSALEDALDELRACRTLLATLDRPPADRA